MDANFIHTETYMEMNSSPTKFAEEKGKRLKLRMSRQVIKELLKGIITHVMYGIPIHWVTI